MSARFAQQAANPAERNKRTLVDGYAKVVRNVVLANVENRIRRTPGRPRSRPNLRERLALPLSVTHLVFHVELLLPADDLGVRVHGIELLAVLRGDRKDLPSDAEEVVLVAEEELDVLAPVAEEVIGLRRGSLALKW